MKKTFTINISGSVFHIDEDAYEKLQGYLQMLTGHFGTDADGREILQDIEARISELFSKKMQEEEKDVIIEPWVDDVISRMGKPEDFMEPEEVEEEKTENVPPVQGKVKRRMYRDPDNRVLGGVCSGMGAYFNIDPVVLRIIFFVLFWISIGTASLVYILLWIAVPKAKTTAQRLEMRGQEATVSNIEKSIKEEVKEVKESYKRFRSSDTYNKGREQAGRLGDVTYSVLKVILKIIVIFFGVLLILVGFVGLVSFITSMFVGHSVMTAAPWIGHWGPEFRMPEVAHFFIDPASMTVLMVAIAFLVGIPLLAILFVGAKMVFRFQSNNKLIFLAGLGVWLVSLITVVVVSLGQIDDYSKKTTISQSSVVNCQDCKTLYLELGEDAHQNDYSYEMDLERMKVISENGESILLGRPRLDIEKSNTDEFVILIRKKSRGGSQEAAKENVDDIVYNYSQKDSTVYFDPYYTLKDGKRWLGQEVDITVKVPEGKSIYLGDKMVKIIYDIENVSNTWDGDMIDKFWKMTELGLEERATIAK